MKSKMNAQTAELVRWGKRRPRLCRQVQRRRSVLADLVCASPPAFAPTSSWPKRPASTATAGIIVNDTLQTYERIHTPWANAPITGAPPTAWWRCSSRLAVRQPLGHVRHRPATRAPVTSTKLQGDR